MNYLFRKYIMRQIDIPADLDSIITIDKEKEVAPHTVGMRKADVDQIWDQVIRVYRAGVHPAITLHIRRRGAVLVSRAIGHTRGNGPQDGPEAEKVLATPDSPFCLFSGSKCITALLVHMLAEENLINLMDPVAFYAPEFARKGKENINIHQILGHRGGIPGLPPDTPLTTFLDEDRTWELLCDSEPIITDGSKLAYHAITGGFVLERVMRTVTGDSFSAYIDKKIRKPMEMKYFTYGIAPEHREQLVRHYLTGPRSGPLLNALSRRVLGDRVESLGKMLNDERLQDVVSPAANLAASAEEVTRFFQMMLDGGMWGEQRICARNTIARAVQEFGNRTLDQTLKVPIRYSAGFMLGDEPFGLWGPHSHHAFGHLGLINKFNWADPEREIAVSLLTSGVPLVTPHILPLVNLIRAIGNRVPRKKMAEPFALSIATRAAKG
jgi:CubicO group peptidase (beta-lactamase class C family)